MLAIGDTIHIARSRRTGTSRPRLLLFPRGTDPILRSGSQRGYLTTRKRNGDAALSEMPLTVALTARVGPNPERCGTRARIGSTCLGLSRNSFALGPIVVLGGILHEPRSPTSSPRRLRHRCRLRILAVHAQSLDGPCNGRGSPVADGVSMIRAGNAPNSIYPSWHPRVTAEAPLCDSTGSFAKRAEGPRRLCISSELAPV